MLQLHPSTVRCGTMKEDWYRSPDDSPEAMADFEQRLSRARPNNRAQYLRVKAVTLAQQPNQCARQIAIALLRRIISDFADEWHEVNFSHEMLGRIHENDGRFEEAEREYRWVVGAYAKSSSGTSGLCDLTLAELIIRTKQSAKFFEAVRLLEQAAGNITFNADWFRYWVAAARVAAARLAVLLGRRR